MILPDLSKKLSKWKTRFLRSKAPEVDDIITTCAKNLLENKPFISIVEELSDIMDEMSQYQERTSTEEGQFLLKLFVERIQEALVRNGLDSMQSDTLFSLSRHIPFPIVIVKEGTQISKIHAPGLAIENRVFRKAKVEFKSEDK